MNKWYSIRFISYLNIMRTFTLVALMALVLAANCWVYAGHEMKGDASKAVFEGLKKELLAIAPTLANQVTGQALKNDLQKTDSSKFSLKEIDNASVAQIFIRLGLKDPNCDKDGNGKVNGNELKCLSKLWKYYLPK